MTLALTLFIPAAVLAVLTMPLWLPLTVRSR